MLATILSCPRLPASGETFRYFYLCNTSVLDENPVVFHALIEHVYADFQSQGYQFFTLAMDENDPLQPPSRVFLSAAYRSTSTQ